MQYLTFYEIWRAFSKERYNKRKGMVMNMKKNRKKTQKPPKLNETLNKNKTKHTHTNKNKKASKKSKIKQKHKRHYFMKLTLMFFIIYNTESSIPGISSGSHE